MANVNKRRSEIQRLIQRVRQEAYSRNRAVTTIDPVLRAGKQMFPMYSNKELYDYCSTALRIILSEPAPQTNQTTLLIHV